MRQLHSAKKNVSQKSGPVKKKQLTEYVKYLVNELMSDPEFKESANADTYRLLQEIIETSAQGDEIKAIGTFTLIRDMAVEGVSLKAIKATVARIGGIKPNLVGKI